MKDNFFFFFATLLLLVACNQNNKIKTTATGKKDTALVGIPVTDPDLGDDSVFTDGSIPTTWEVAGISDVNALKIFIKDLQMMVAADNKEELSGQIRYPLNKTVKTAAEFTANYNKIVTPAVKRGLADVNLRQLFRNYQGVMIGNGEIWIAQEGKNFKIIAINN